MSVLKLKSNPKFYYVDGHITINGKSYHYSKKSIKNEKFKSKKWCQELEQEMVHEIKRKHNLLDSKLEDYTLDDLSKDFIKKMEVDAKKESTIKGFSYKYEKYYKPFFDGKSLVQNTFTEDKVQDFKIYVRDINVSTDYKNLILNTLSQLINFAARKKKITYEDERMLIDDLEPFRNFDGKSHLHKYTPPEDAKKVWENASDEYFRYVIELFYYSGCRISEFLAIFPKDIRCMKDMNNDLIISIDIYKQIFNLEDGVVPYLKNASSIRTIYYVGEVAEHFIEFLKLKELKDDDLLFPFSKNKFRRELNKALDKANVEHNTFHGFGRKSIATNLYLESKDGKLPQLLLGHKNVDMTLNTYVLENCMKDELLNKLKKIENIK